MLRTGHKVRETLERVGRIYDWNVMATVVERSLRETLGGASESGHRRLGACRMSAFMVGYRGESRHPDRANVTRMTHSGHRNAFAERELRNVGRQWIGLIRLEAGELDHLGPLLGLLGDDLGEVGG